MVKWLGIMCAESANLRGAIPSTEIRPIAIVDVVSRSIACCAVSTLDVRDHLEFESDTRLEKTYFTLGYTCIHSSACQLPNLNWIHVLAYHLTIAELPFTL